MNSGISKIIFFFGVLIIGGIYLALSGNGPILVAEKSAPCTDSLTLSVGEIDNRYSISEEELQEILTDVAALWSKAAGRELVVVTEDGDIPVHLIYSEDQARSTMERQLNDRIESMRLELSVLEREYNRAQDQYDDRLDNYNDDARALQSDLSVLKNWVQQINEQGGFRDSQVRQLEERQQQIDNRTRELDRRRIVLSSEADELNRQLDYLNTRIADKNRAIEEYNRSFSGTRRFTQGSFEWHGAQRRINVFHFNGLRELKLVLAHETGHALGVDHVENPASVMYHLMGNQNMVNITLTDEDRAALYDVCGINQNIQ
ncbi:MAG: matrixin family metalloprotease [Balneolaceae bacterium]|nr:matrixin family metalloprotease [Balneolaceae bacterium]